MLLYLNMGKNVIAFSLFSCSKKVNNTFFPNLFPFTRNQGKLFF